MREGFRLAGEIGFRVFESRSGTLLAEVEAEAGRVEAGLATLDAQFAVIAQTGERSLEAEMNRVRGELLLRLEPPDNTGAEAAYTRAIEIARSQQTRTFELRAALSLAKLHHARGRIEDVRELLEPALVGFSVGPELPEVAEAERLVGRCRVNL